MLELQPFDPGCLVWPAQGRPGSLREREVPVTVTRAEGRLLATLAQPFHGVLADRLQQSVARPPLLVVGQDQGAVHQMRQDGEGSGSGFRAGGRGSYATETRNLTPSTQVEAAGEHGERPQHPPLWLVQEVVAPIDGCAERLLARHDRAQLGRQEAEPIVEPLRDLDDTQRAQAGGGKLDRQRDAVKVAADLGDHLRVAVAEGEGGLHQAGPIHEQADRRRRRDLVASPSRRADPGPAAAEPARSSRPGTPSGSRLVARMWSAGHSRRSRSTSSAQAATRCSQLSRTISSRLVPSAAASVARSGSPGTSFTPSAAATAWGTRAASARAASSTRRTPEGHAADEPGRDLERQSGLSDAAGAGQREQARSGEQAPDLIALRLSPDERGELNRADSTERAG